MVDLHLNRSFHQHTRGPNKGMTVVEHWYPHDPHIRYRTCFSTKVWQSMATAAREQFGFDTLIKAGKALTGAKEQKRSRR